MVRGIKRPVQPDSPCARTERLACPYDTTAAIAATPSTASAVDHLMTRSAAFTTHHRRPARTLPRAAVGFGAVPSHKLSPAPAEGSDLLRH